MLRILVLDDDVDNCVTLEHIIRFAGHDVQSTSDSRNFFSLISSWEPEIVIVDLLLGETDGITVLTELVPLPVKPEVIVLSGAHSRLLEAASRSASGHGFSVLGTLAKPFNPDRLRQLLAKYKKTEKENPPVAASKHIDLSLEDLTSALQQDLFYVVYQPKIECRTTSLSGFEALCRLRLPEIGEISPDVFIPLCEKYGLITQLTQFVISTSIQWFSSFLHNSNNHPQQLNAKGIKLAINISALSIGQEDVFNFLIAKCISHGVSANAIILELTETAAMADPVASLDILTRLRLYGFQLSIDDFGTGYSSILQLVRLPFSELKIDKHFVSTAAESKESRLVISSVINMAHALGLTVTAEGIENRQTLSFLQKKHCDAAQGFYISKPLKKDQIAAWVATHQDDNELARLKTLRALDILDSAPEERFDRILRLTQRVFDVPICTMSLIDQHRIWYKAKIGMSLDEIERKDALCELATQKNSAYIVPDTRVNTDTRNNAMVVGKPFFRFYAGHPIAAPNGVVIGSLCLIDFKPRTVLNTAQDTLKDLASMIEEEFISNQRTTVDTLTQMKNRASFDTRAHSLIKLSQSYKLKLHVINIKINFYNPEAADLFNVFQDRVLRKTAQLIKKSFSGADLSARIEDNSFLILFVAQDDILTHLALESFNNLMIAEKTNKQPHSQFKHYITTLDCINGELSSLQQLYMKLDLKINDSNNIYAVG